MSYQPWLIVSKNPTYLEPSTDPVATTSKGFIVIDGSMIRIVDSYTPATAGAAGNKGAICYDANYIYVCTATNTWKRATLATW